jgi:superfamily I DNA/RNA helicase
MHGRRPIVRSAPSRAEELAALARQIRTWLDSGIEAHALGVAARAGHVVKQARDALRAAGLPTLALTTQSTKSAVRAGTMHSMKGLEFQAVAVLGEEQGTVPAGSAVTPSAEDPLATTRIYSANDASCSSPVPEPATISMSPTPASRAVPARLTQRPPPA